MGERGGSEEREVDGIAERGRGRETGTGSKMRSGHKRGDRDTKNSIKFGLG